MESKGSLSFLQGSFQPPPSHSLLILFSHLCLCFSDGLFTLDFVTEICLTLVHDTCPRVTLFCSPLWYLVNRTLYNFLCDTDFVRRTHSWSLYILAKLIQKLHFPLYWYVNVQDDRYRSFNKLRAVHERSLYGRTSEPWIRASSGNFYIAEPVTLIATCILVTCTTLKYISHKLWSCRRIMSFERNTFPPLLGMKCVMRSAGLGYRGRLHASLILTPTYGSNKLKFIQRNQDH
jgi:hypothetical protein